MHEKSIYSAGASLYQNGMEAKPILNTLKLQREREKKWQKGDRSCKLFKWANSNF